MNKILKLLDQDYVLAMMKRKLLPLYPEYERITGITIVPFKRLVWETTYHVVFGYNVDLVKKDGAAEQILVVCSAHSDEPRDNVFKAMQYLWERSFGRGNIDIPQPLFYSEYFRGTFYRGLSGENILHYIVARDYKEVRSLILLSAQLFARLHSLPVGPEADFNPENSRIETVVPGVAHILEKMSERYEGRYDNDFKKIYQHFLEAEEKFFRLGHKTSLIHGDAHTENLIRTGFGRIGLIDFTDFCLGDYARDLGTFLQQMEYKFLTKNSDPEEGEKMKKLFLDSYLKLRGLKMDADLQERIELYYDWTSMRTAVYLFLRHNQDPERAIELLDKVKERLGI